ncbi:MAG: hypothetical protein ACOX33_03380 [Dethiobacteria bacterium]
MIFDNWYYHLLRVIPEAIAIVAFGTALIKEKYSFKKISLTGLIVGIIGFIYQRAPITYGVQIPLGIIVAMLTMSFVLKLKISRSAAATLLSFIVLVFAEWLTVVVQISVLGYSEEQIVGGSDLSKFLNSLPPLVVFIILAIIMQVRLHLNAGRLENQTNQAG